MVSLNAKIKIRRGLRDDLVDLSSAEFGFTTDTGEVFIGAPDLPSLQGKGKGEPGEIFPYRNVQLLTTSSPLAHVQYYTYQGNGPIEVQTGPSVSSPVVRTYQSKFDDIVNFADFDSELTNDRTADINRMLRQIYNGSAETERKICNISAGTYLVNQTVKLPPYTMLRGEGIDRTILYHNDPNPTGIVTMFETVDNLFQEGTQIGTNGANLPNRIELCDMTIRIDNLMDFVRAYRTSNVSFTRVKFVGTGKVSSQRSVLMVDRLGVVVDISGFKFNNCEFENISNVINPLVADTNIASDFDFNQCKFTNVYNIMTSLNPNVKNIHVSMNRFMNITTTQFNIAAGINFSSSNNTYDDANAVSPNFPIILGSNTSKCSSMNDTFFGISVSNEADDFIYISKNAAVFEYQGFLQSGRRIETIEANKIDGTLGSPFAMSDYDIVRISYNIRRGTIQRSGVVTVTHDYSTSLIYDNYNENDDIGIIFNATQGVFNGKLSMIVQYQSTPGSSATVSYQFSAVKSA